MAQDEQYWLNQIELVIIELMNLVDNTNYKLQPINWEVRWYIVSKKIMAPSVNTSSFCYAT